MGFEAWFVINGNFNTLVFGSKVATLKMTFSSGSNVLIPLKNGITNISLALAFQGLGNAW